MSWSDLEIREVSATIAAIDAFASQRRLATPGRPLRLAVSEIGDLSEGIWGSFPVTFIRHIYRELGFDEHRVFNWSLEHKLIQALVLNHYSPGCMPATRGLSRSNGASFIKPTLGDSSGDRQPASLLDETWIVQDRVPIATEYRVHSFEARIVEDLTFHRYGKGDIPGERDAPNAFVQSILDRLPDAIVAGSLCGWDIARTPASGFLVIEVNFTGFHPIFNRGFQTSGWFHDADWGALSAARLVRFLEQHCGLEVSILPDAPSLETANRFYASVERSRQLLQGARENYW
ncbi:MAG: hypothetical protein JO340_17820 [Acidobacteriaceae bacterium]|nr:hypothetical protein [Acidobacteriaceae bacterium]